MTQISIMKYFKYLISLNFLLICFVGFCQNPNEPEQPGILKKFKVIDQINKINKLASDDRNFKLTPDSLKVSWFSQGSSQSYSDTTFYRFNFLDDETKKLFDTVVMYDQRDGHDYLVTYQYNSAFKRTRIDFYRKSGSSLSYYGSEIYKYDDHNTAVKYECNLPNYVDQDSMRYVYDSQNRIVEHYDYEYNWQNQWILKRHVDSITYDNTNVINGYVEQFENGRYKYSDLVWRNYNANTLFYALDPEIDFDYVHINSKNNYFKYRNPETIVLSELSQYVLHRSEGLGLPYSLNGKRKTITNFEYITQYTDYISMSGNSSRDSLQLDINNGLIHKADNFYNGQFQSSRIFKYNDQNLLIKDSISTGWVFDMTYELDSELNLLLYEIDLHKNGVQDDRTKYEFYTLGTLGFKKVEENIIPFKIYPNPAHNLIKVSLAGSNDLNWRIIEIGGKEMLKGKKEQDSFEINLNLLNSGIYFIHLNNSEKCFISKFTKL